jgi:hypothetical protein
MKYRVLTAAAMLVFSAAPLAHAHAVHANSGQASVFCSDGSITYSPSTLWPNHRLQTITISFNQPCDDGPPLVPRQLSAVPGRSA